MKLNYKGKIFVCGLPRSGSMILSRVIAGVDNAAGVANLSCGDNNNKLSAPDIYATNYSGRDVIIVKENYQAPVYTGTNNWFYCFKYLHRKDWFPLTILRNPTDTYYSTRQHEWKGWETHTVETFSEGYIHYCNMLDKSGITPVILERFISDPIKEIERVSSLRFTGDLVVGKIFSVIGNCQQLNGDKAVNPKPSIYTDVENINGNLKDAQQYYQHFLP